MNVENLAQLSFSQLSEIQRRIDTAISEKKMMRVGDSASDILDLLASNYSDVDLWDVLTELAFRSQLKVDLKKSQVNCEELPEKLMSSDSSDLLPRDLQLLADRLKTIRNAVLQHDDSRLLWLTNGGTQKTSKLFGKDLAEVLQEAIKRLERLNDDDEDDKKTQDLNSEIIKIDEWAEFKLGLSLLYGTLTVINPFSSRDNPRTSQRAPIFEHGKNKVGLELNFPLNQRRGTSGYA